MCKRALEYVAHPSLRPDFSDDIIVVLVRNAKKGDYSLALSYYYTVQPIFNTSRALELLFDAMTRTNISEALMFSRTYPEHTREQLFRRWITGALQSAKGEKAGQITQLAYIPFDSAEEAWFEEHLTRGDGRALRRARDTLLLRKIASDQLADVSKVRANGQWASVIEGIRKGTEGLSE